MAPAAGRRRLRDALAARLTDAGAASDAAALQALASAPIEGIGEIPYGSNAVFILQLAAEDPARPGQPMRAVYKPARGERPLWDFPLGTLCLREVAAYLVDAALGMDHVPPTTLRDGPAGPGSLQLFVHAAGQRAGAGEEPDLEQQLRDIAALDVLINNADRKRTHLLLAEGLRIRAIDNALSFLPYPRQRTALIALGGERLPRPTAARVRALASDIRRLQALESRLTTLLSGEEVEAFSARVRELAADPTYPVLDDWDGRPFEWW